jgi:hypothetical protein
MTTSISTDAATHAVSLLVDVDVVARREHGEERVRTRHALCGTVVHAVAGSESTTFDVADWQVRLAEVCQVTDPPATDAAPAPDLEVPWDLVLGTGAALDRHRPDLYDVLVARADGSVRAAGRPLGPAAAHTEVLRLHRTVVGRLRCTGTLPSSRRVGWVSWLLYADGWRALTPYAGDVGGHVRPMVRLERRRPADLAYDVARWAVAR